MDKTPKRPRVEYRVVLQKDMTYGVEVHRPNAIPSTVTTFATSDEAEAWIKQQRDANQRAKSIVDRVTRDD